MEKSTHVYRYVYKIYTYYTVCIYISINLGFSQGRIRVVIGVTGDSRGILSVGQVSARTYRGS